MGDNSLVGRHAVVTGGGSGIGASIATSLVNAGARVTLMGRDSQRLEAQRDRFASDLREAISCVSVDVTSEDAVSAAFAEATTRHGHVDLLVNNAGQAQSSPFAQTDMVLWRQMLDVNLTGVFLCTRAVLPSMLDRKGGRIVNVASTAGQTGYAYVAAYCAAKHGVIGLTRALAREVATSGITVNAVCPGYTETELLHASLANITATTSRTEHQARDALLRQNPQRRFIDPAEVAHAVMWLCASESASITGQSISVSGGEIL
jgi:3-hydroxybutyrate dehydrogenase